MRVGNRGCVNELGVGGVGAGARMRSRRSSQLDVGACVNELGLAQRRRTASPLPSPARRRPSRPTTGTSRAAAGGPCRAIARRSARPPPSPAAPAPCAGAVGEGRSLSRCCVPLHSEVTMWSLPMKESSTTMSAGKMPMFLSFCRCVPPNASRCVAVVCLLDVGPRLLSAKLLQRVHCGLRRRRRRPVGAARRG